MRSSSITIDQIKSIAKDIIDDTEWVNDSESRAEYMGMKRGIEAVIRHFDNNEPSDGSIFIKWCRDDVRYAEKMYQPTASLSISEIDRVLAHAEDNHNADIGICWDAIRISIEAIVDWRV